MRPLRKHLRPVLYDERKGNGPWSPYLRPDLNAAWGQGDSDTEFRPWDDIHAHFARSAQAIKKVRRRLVLGTVPVFLFAAEPEFLHPVDQCLAAEV